MSGFSRDARGVSYRLKNLKGGSPEKYETGDFGGENTSSAVNAVCCAGKLCSITPPTIDFTTDTQYGASRVMTGESAEGNVELIRVGAYIYGRVGGDAPVRLNGITLADDRNVILRMGGAFYVITGMSIYRINDSLAVSRFEPRVPQLYRSLAIDAPDVPAFREEPNALTDYVDINYAVGSNATTMIFVPDTINVASIEYVKVGSSTYTRTYTLVSGGTRKKAVSFTDGISGNVTIRFRLSSTASDGTLSLSDFATVRNALLRARYVVKYQPVGDYSLMLGTCGYDKKFYVIGISDMAYITTDSAVSANVEQTPTAAVNYGDGTLIFTEKRILFAVVSGGGVISTGVDINISVLKRDFGCDAPRAAVSFDDKIFFLSSDFGVFYLDKFGYAERDGSCPISLPVREELLSHTKEELKDAVAACTSSALYICVGDDVYMYKYADMLPSSPGESEEKQRRYFWSKLSALCVEGFISSRGATLSYLERESGNVMIFDGAKEPSQNDAAGAYYEFMPTSLDCTAEKVMQKLVVSAKFYGNATLTIKYDGAPTGYSFTLTPSECAGCETYIIRAPRDRFVTASVCIGSESGMTLSGVELYYFTV